MEEKLSELIELYATKGEVNLSTLIDIEKNINNMKKKDKKRLRTYSIAISLMGEIAGEKLNEVFLILAKLKKKKIITKIIAHRKIMGYD